MAVDLRYSGLTLSSKELAHLTGIPEEMWIYSDGGAVVQKGCLRFIDPIGSSTSAVIKTRKRVNYKFSGYLIVFGSRDRKEVRSLTYHPCQQRESGYPNSLY